MRRDLGPPLYRKGAIHMTRTIITIGRQYGSGGKEIGLKVAEKLGIQCYDSRLIQMAAQEADMDAERLAHVDEKRANPFLFSVSYENLATGNGYLLPMNDTLFNIQSDIIQKLAMQESCIFIGRCADTVLKNQQNVYSVFIRADWDARIQRICKLHTVGEKEAAAICKKMDKQRALYYNYFTDKKWSDANNYDIVLNSTALGIDKCVDTIISLFS